MGIGQIVTLRLPPHLLNVVNVEIERCAWGVFSTEFFPTYDFIPVRERLAREWREACGKASGGGMEPEAEPPITSIVEGEMTMVFGKARCEGLNRQL